MRSSFKVATIGGIDILVNWTWLLAVLFLTWSLGAYYHNTFTGWSPETSYILGAISAILLFVTVLIHELAHSFTARARGLPVTQIQLFIFGGVSNLTREPETPGTEFVVAIAGPAASLLIAGFFALLHYLLRGLLSAARSPRGGAGGSGLPCVCQSDPGALQSDSRFPVGWRARLSGYSLALQR